MHADLQHVFEEALHRDLAQIQHETHTTRETAHGRTTERTDHALASPHDHPQRDKWRDLRTLVIATCCVTKADQETWETRWYISDLAPRATALGAAIRKQWGIENGPQWVLAVAFREDAARQQDRNGSANLAAVRRLIVRLLRQERTLTRRAKAKRMVCALDPTYLLQVFATAVIGA